MQLAQDRRYVSFMYSYPNMIPLNARAVERIVQAVEPFAFDRIYGGWAIFKLRVLLEYRKYSKMPQNFRHQLCVLLLKANSCLGYKPESV